MQFERSRLNRRDAMDAERNEEAPDQIRSLKGEWFPSDSNPSLLCVHRVSAVSFRLPELYRLGTPCQTQSPFSSCHSGLPFLSNDAWPWSSFEFQPIE